MHKAPVLILKTLRRPEDGDTRIVLVNVRSLFIDKATVNRLAGVFQVQAALVMPLQARHDKKVLVNEIRLLGLSQPRLGGRNFVEDLHIDLENHISREFLGIQTSYLFHEGQKDLMALRILRDSSKIAPRFSFHLLVIGRE